MAPDAAPWEPPLDPRVPEEAWATWPLYLIWAVVIVGVTLVIVFGVDW